MKITDFECLTLDCYGTMIDWELGIKTALRPWAEHRRLPAADDQLLALFGQLESEEEARHPELPYPHILRNAHLRMAERLGMPADETAAREFGESVKDWPAFPDSPEALAYLARQYKLVVLSNVDRGSFKHSNEKLGVTFFAVYTAEDIGSYKPSIVNFRYALDKLAARGVGHSRILHTAQSLFHDIVPASQVGLATMWIDRRHGRDGWGATPPPGIDVKPNFTAASLADFAAQHRAASSGDPEPPRVDRT
ncbi:MAG: HAD hydrolase-like protein [Pseudomonadota bacterium]